MFDSVTGVARRPRRRLGPAVVAAAALHGAGVAVAAGLAAAPAEAPREVEVTFVRPAAAAPPDAAPPAVPPAPSPAPPPRRPAPAHAEAPATVLPQAIVAPTTMPPEPAPVPAPAGGQPEGAAAVGEEVAAVAGGVSGPVVDASAAPEEFDGGRMSHPVKVSGPDPRYTPEALAREIEGTMAVRCVVTVEGAVRDCRVVRGLPFMDGAVVEALERRRYRPALRAGVPVEVDYTFRITLRLP